MERVYGVREEIKKPTILISTPCHDDRVNISYMLSIIDTIRLLEIEGFEVDVQIPSKSSLITHTRNAILQRFMDTGYDYLLMIDSDLGWAPESVVRLIFSDKEFCGGVYPARDGNGFKFRPVTDNEGKIVICQESRLLKMEYIPAGFILLKRSAIKKMQAKFPELRYEPKSENSIHDSGYCLFNTEVWDGEFWGEDYTFCRKARESDIEIWVDPMIPFNHAGIQGIMMDILTNDKSKANLDTIIISTETEKPLE